MFDAMWSFNWGVFWAALAALVISRYMPWRYTDKWIADVINKFLQKHDRLIELQEEQLDKQDSILNRLPSRQHIDW